jgi:hypothetical protein
VVGKLFNLDFPLYRAGAIRCGRFRTGPHAARGIPEKGVNGLNALTDKTPAEVILERLQAMFKVPDLMHVQKFLAFHFSYKSWS